MPVIEIQGDLLESDCDILCHGCNCFHTMGSGVARAIREKYPQAYTADIMHSPKGDRSKLGKISAHPVTLPKGTVGWVFNMYTQYEFGTHKRQLDYEALINCMEELKIFLAREDAKSYKVGMPRIGCGLAGGDWDAVKAIINYVFPDKDIYVYYL